jgi:hypothetical protein
MFYGSNEKSDDNYKAEDGNIDNTDYEEWFSILNRMQSRIGLCLQISEYGSLVKKDY